MNNETFGFALLNETWCVAPLKGSHGGKLAIGFLQDLRFRDLRFKNLRFHIYDFRWHDFLRWSKARRSRLCGKKAHLSVGVFIGALFFTRSEQCYSDILQFRTEKSKQNNRGSYMVIIFSDWLYPTPPDSIRYHLT